MSRHQILHQGGPLEDYSILHRSIASYPLLHRFSGGRFSFVVSCLDFLAEHALEVWFGALGLAVTVHGFNDLARLQSEDANAPTLFYLTQMDYMQVSAWGVVGALAASWMYLVARGPHKPSYAAYRNYYTFLENEAVCASSDRWKQKAITQPETKAEKEYFLSWHAGFMFWLAAGRHWDAMPGILAATQERFSLESDRILSEALAMYAARLREHRHGINADEDRSAIFKQVLMQWMQSDTTVMPDDAHAIACFLEYVDQDVCVEVLDSLLKNGSLTREVFNILFLRLISLPDWQPDVLIEYCLKMYSDEGDATAIGPILVIALEYVEGTERGSRDRYLIANTLASYCCRFKPQLNTSAAVTLCRLLDDGSGWFWALMETANTITSVSWHQIDMFQKQVLSGVLLHLESTLHPLERSRAEYLLGENIKSSLQRHYNTVSEERLFYQRVADVVSNLIKLSAENTLGEILSIIINAFKEMEARDHLRLLYLILASVLKDEAMEPEYVYRMVSHLLSAAEVLPYGDAQNAFFLSLAPSASHYHGLRHLLPMALRWAYCMGCSIESDQSRVANNLIDFLKEFDSASWAPYWQSVEENFMNLAPPRSLQYLLTHLIDRIPGEMGDFYASLLCRVVQTLREEDLFPLSRVFQPILKSPGTEVRVHAFVTRLFSSPNRVCESKPRLAAMMIMGLFEPLHRDTAQLTADMLWGSPSTKTYAEQCRIRDPDASVEVIRAMLRSFADSEAGNDFDDSDDCDVDAIRHHPEFVKLLQPILSDALCERLDIGALDPAPSLATLF